MTAIDISQFRQKNTMGLQNLFLSNASGIDMNREFRGALDQMENTGSNIFITGRAGTGKSTLLEYFRSVTKKNVAVLAPTGVAALNVKGQTIHSFFHFKPDITLETVRRAYGPALYKSLDAIVIDEISMVRADLLDCVDRFMRINGKDSELPFGGVQMILIGDLYQLPPVVTDTEEEIFRTHYRSPYFFDSHSFSGLRIKYIELKKHYRQKEQEFIDLLNAIRNNSILDSQIGQLNSRVDPAFEPRPGEHYVTLTPTNRLADHINSMRLNSIQKPTRIFKAHISSDFDKRIHPAPESLELKEGAQVMMLNNDRHKRWVNGSMGEIVGMEGPAGWEGVITVRLLEGYEAKVEPHTWDVFRFSYDVPSRKLVSKNIGSFMQYPMMLAWAVTIHKSQGKTFDRVVIDLGSGTFAHGQLYVALSRCTTMGGVVLKRPVERRHIMMDRRIVEFLNGHPDAD
jgi:ATP-dependent exoDNAse (exonuclease V) alpha subunit